MNNENMYHVIKDPVHGTMQFTTTEDNWIKPFVDSPNFQRLRHIKQLGMGDFIFPGAVHSRFNHSLGCCFVASQIAHKIGLAGEERQLVMIACLLHDIGHGPFSHAFEDIFQHKVIRHEAWTPFFLAEFRTPEFFDHYNRRNPRHHLTEEKFLLIEAMIMHKYPQKRVLADIVSSQLDADRLDYLLRDSHFCGVTYGQFDLRWMLHCLAIVDSGKGERLGLTHKGIGVVEHYLMARRLMTRNIYHYQKKLALEFFLVKFLQSLSECLAEHKPFAEIKKSRLGKFLLAANQFNQSLSGKKNIEPQKLHFLSENYQNYKELCDYDVFALVKELAQMIGDHPVIQIAQRIQNRIMPKIIRIDSPQIHGLVEEFRNKHKKEFHDWQFAIIKSPLQSYSNEDDPILIVNELGVVKPLNEISVMINAISDKYENTTFLCIDQSIIENDKVQRIIKDLSSPALMEI